MVALFALLFNLRIEAHSWWYVDDIAQKLENFKETHFGNLRDEICEDLKHTLRLPSTKYLSFRHFLHLKIALKANFWPRHHIQDCLFYTVTWSCSQWEGFLMVKKCLTIKKSFCMENSQFLACMICLGLFFYFFLQKNLSGDCHGSVEIHEILFKALRTSIGAG